jgi:hypothetical protein
MLNFVIRQDPSGYDYSNSGAPRGSWTEIDLSSIVSESAQAVLLNVVFYTSTANKSYVKFAQKGETGSQDSHFLATPNGIDYEAGADMIVELDSSKKVHYYVHDCGGTAFLRVTVAGWWEPAHQ